MKIDEILYKHHQDKLIRFEALAEIKKAVLEVLPKKKATILGSYKMEENSYARGYSKAIDDTIERLSALFEE
jgi:hypothetical protein